MNTSKPSLIGNRLTKTFGEGELATYALREVSLELYAGQVSLLIGPSGSGKSTLLAVLSGLLRPDAGTATAFDTDLWTLTERQREAFRRQHYGFIFQGYNLFPALNARQQLEMVLRWGQGLSRREAGRRTDDMLELLGLARKARLRPAQLSGGEKQRVAVGRALVKQPAVCFADEPTSALDWEHGEQVVRLLRATAIEHGTTVLIVSHDPRIVPFVDQVLHIEDGHLTEQVPTSGRPQGAMP
ncbi:MAG TPA: ABC transporter ATP-binding protein [Gemmataceae bacterium]|nr:ABC transporter ATP-binding protein [Gemmataceae bacterium]